MKKLLLVLVLGLGLSGYAQSYITKGYGKNNITFHFTQDSLVVSSKVGGRVVHLSSFKGDSAPDHPKLNVKTYIVTDPKTDQVFRYKVMQKGILLETVDNFTGQVSSHMFLTKELNINN